MNEWSELADRYVEECAERGLAAATLQKVQSEVDRWTSWLRRRRPRPRPGEVGADLIVRYVGERTVFRSKATVASVLTTLRGLGEFLVREKVWAANPMRWMRGPKVHGRRVPRRLNEEAQRRLWQAAATTRGAYARRLWLAVLGVLYGTGARRMEVIELNLSDWDREEGLLSLNGRKTGWERRLPVPELTARCLEGYLAVREEHLARQGVADETALFVNHTGGRLSRGSVSGALKRLRKRSGVEGVTLHWFRHSCASDLLEDGASLPEVQQYLGHRHIGSTMRYIHVADPQRQRAAELHPINQMLREESGHE